MSDTAKERAQIIERLYQQYVDDEIGTEQEMAEAAYDAGRKAGIEDALKKAYGLRVFTNESAYDVHARMTAELEQLSKLGEKP
jgi:hypothetical protein